MNSNASSELPTVMELYEAVLVALRRFGEYTFQDKGAADVMDIYALGTRLENGSAVDVAKALRSLAHSGPTEKFRQTFSLRAASAFVVGMQEWDELFEQPGIVDLLNVKMPTLLPGDEPSAQEAAPPVARRPRPG